MTVHLPYGLVAEIVTSPDDRPPYVPPPPDPIHQPYVPGTCPCPVCVAARRVRELDQ